MDEEHHNVISAMPKEIALSYIIHPDYTLIIDAGRSTSLEMSEHESFDQAKAVAQADYEARTAERFRKVEIPVDAPFDNNLHTDMVHGYDTAIDALLEAIAKAKDNTL
jgi:hypothetical protein